MTIADPQSKRLVHPAWSRDAAIYQINTRQFTEAGTLAAAQEHLDRLQTLGVRILWLMPIHEIGEKRRKGRLGSPYAVRDYYSVDPHIGSRDDLQRFVAAAHERAMYVILDWVANHTAWDCNLIDEHPEWYARDASGAIRSTPWHGWTDVADLDFDQPALRQYMLDAMVHWVETADIDGYRCDVAGFVPLDFWMDARRALERIKPVFLLAEWEARDLHDAFDASYAWSWYDAMHAITTGDGSIRGLNAYYGIDLKAYPHDAMRMTFVSNHDKNTWDGTQFEQFGDGLEAAIVLSVVGSGIPLLYNGQEAGNPRRLPFFEREPIVWREHPIGALYQRLFALKRDTRSLWNGAWGAPMERVVHDATDHVFAFVRRGEHDAVLALFNLSAEPHTLQCTGDRHHGTYRDAFTDDDVPVDATTTFELAPWSYRVLVMGGGAQ